MAGLNDLVNDAPKMKTSGLNSVLEPSSNKELMADARESLKGNWGIAVLGHILYTVFIGCFYFFILAAALFVGFTTGVCGEDFNVVGKPMQIASQIVEFFISGALAVGFCSFFLGIAQADEAQLDRLFAGFRRFWTSLFAYFFVGLFTFLWTLLFIIPGIIAAFRYSMVYFVIADDEDCGPFEAIRRSKEMMKGNKWKLFCLSWRFFWWILLVTFFTFGIGYLWLIPYMQTSFAKFYEDVK